MKKQESQSAEEFAQLVQETIAKELKIEATKYTSQDKSEYLKRRRIDTNLGKIRMFHQSIKVEWCSFFVAIFFLPCLIFWD